MTYLCKLLKDTMETVDEICILIKYSPKREKLLGEIKDNIINENDQIEETENSASIDKLCLTKWTVRAKCYKKIIDNYDPLIELFEYCYDPLIELFEYCYDPLLELFEYCYDPLIELFEYCYDPLIELFEYCLTEGNLNAELKACVIGCHTQITNLCNKWSETG